VFRHSTTSLYAQVLPDEERATASRYDATVKVERKPVMDPPKVTPPHEAGAAAAAAPPPVVHKRTLKNLPKQEKKNGFPSSKRKIMQVRAQEIGYCDCCRVCGLNEEQKAIYQASFLSGSPVCHGIHIVVRAGGCNFLQQTQL